MKKLIFASLIAASLILASANAFAYPKKPANFRDATWLAKEENMTSGFKKPKGIPVGTIIAWNSATPPEDDSWMECNGQAVPADASEYRKKFPQMAGKTPDYRGFFLRGHGNKSSDLNVEQQEAVEVKINSGHKVNIAGLDRGSYYTTGAAKTQEANETVYIVMDFMPDRRKMYSAIKGTGNGNGIGFGSSSNTTSLDLSITSPAGETRPINKAVKYFIKVR